jgi:hypothetical protein
MNLLEAWIQTKIVTEGLLPSFRTLGQLLKIPPFSTQKLHSAHAKFQNPTCLPSGRKVLGPKKRNNGQNVGSADAHTPLRQIVQF